MIDPRVIACARACGVDPQAVITRSRDTRAVKARVAALVMLREDGHTRIQCLVRIGRHTIAVYYRLVSSYIHNRAEIDRIILHARAILDQAREQISFDNKSVVKPEGRCAERGCPMPAAHGDYCRYHWAMMCDPAPFRRQALISSGRLRSGNGRVSLIRVLG